MNDRYPRITPEEMWVLHEEALEQVRKEMAEPVFLSREDLRTLVDLTRDIVYETQISNRRERAAAISPVLAALIAQARNGESVQP